MASKSINAMTLVRLHGLGIKARVRAVTDRRGGGGPNPHRHAFDALDYHLHEKASRDEALKRLQGIDDEDLSERSVDLFLRCLHFLEPFGGTPIEPLCGSAWSPQNIFQITARSHIAIETEGEIISVQFWNNKTADFYSLPAQIASLFFKDIIPPELFKNTRYVFHNLRTGNTYEFDEVTSEAYRARRELVFEIERLLEGRARSRSRVLPSEEGWAERKKAVRR